MELLDISDVAPSTYNPRVADPERLDIIELSLNKLGFVLPIYATKKGEIISGHQRHYVSKRMGLRKVPVEFIADEDEGMRKRINLLFNLGTNDAPRLLSGTQMKKMLEEVDVFKIGENIRDRDRNNLIEMYPCMYTHLLDVKLLVEKNAYKFNEYFKYHSKKLSKYAPKMPIIVDQDYNIINGLGRVHEIVASKRTPSTIDGIILPNELSEFAYYMLNYLTMDFNIHNKYKDELRFNSYRRSRDRRTGIGSGFVVKLVKRPSTVGTNFSPNLVREFKREYGDYILDFGAGHLGNGEILNENGIHCVSFEPFVIDPDKIETINFERSYNVCNNFLDELHENPDFTSIFLHSVFNSVPFEEDRKKILTILSAIATPKTKVIIWTRRIKEYKQILSEINSDKVSSDKYNVEVLDYEPNITIAEIERRPKVQKFYDEKGLIELCKPYFKIIRVAVKNGGMYCECTKPIKQPEEKLMEALDFEFNLKHPDGRTLGLNEKAKKIFKEMIEKREINLR